MQGETKEAKNELQQDAGWRTHGTYLVSDELFLDLVFTSACDCSCPFCIARTKTYAKEDYGKWRESLSKTFAHFPVRSVIILGGEATLDPLFWEKLACVEKLARQKPPEHVILTTNGIRLRDPAFFERLLASCVDAVNLSYMHYDQGANDAIFGQPTLTGAEIKEIYGKLKKTGKSLRLNVNVYRGNMDRPEEMRRFVRTFAACCDTIKFSPLMQTDMFQTVDDVTAYTKKAAIPETEIRVLYDAFAAASRVEKRNPHVLGFVEYAQLELFGQQVILKYAQVEDKYDRDRFIPTLKLYPNGNLSNEWDFEKNLTYGKGGQL